VATLKTTCPYCGVGCGIVATPRPDGGVDIVGDPDHPSNRGQLCSKGTALGETLSLDDRLLHPLVDGQRTSWDRALDLVAGRFADTIAEHGPDSVAFYVSGQLLTEDYYVANKLMKGFIGSANIDTNSRLCKASSVAGHKRAFGSDTVPGCYDDLEQADVVVLAGANLAWCHPVLYQRLANAQERRGTKIVVIDPRQTATAQAADIHLALAPGSDLALFNGLLAHLDAAGTRDDGYIDRHTAGLNDALAAARSISLEQIAQSTGLAPSALQSFYDLFAANERVVTVYSQGINQSIQGTNNVNAIINCHLLTGRIGRPGMGPFSITGQPNAMGGREVGGLSNQLACHMEIENPDHRALVGEFWKTPDLAKEPGLKAVELFQAVRDGQIKALWIMATNPLDSLPEADTVRAALEACPFVVISDVTRHTDTTRYGDVLLPAAAWGEKSGTVTNSERRISRQRPFLPLPGDARPDWWIVTQVARRMGFDDAFPFDHPAQIYAEYAALSGFGNDGTRDFDIGAHGDISRDEYENLTPFQWPLALGQWPLTQGQWPPAQGTTPRQKRFFADGGFFTADRRARFIATPVGARITAPTKALPLILNTGRIRDQWHTMTRTGKSARLMRHRAEPFVEINPHDAAQHGLRDAELASIRSPHGSIVVRVMTSERQPRGSIFVPMHWTDQMASAARVNSLVAGNIDPVSGQPEFKQTAVAIAPFAAAWHGMALAATKPVGLTQDYWSLAPTGPGWRIELAGRKKVPDWSAAARELLRPAAGAELLAYHDAKSGQFRFACFQHNKLIGALFIAPAPIAVSRSWTADQLGANWSDPKDRLRFLAGRGAGETPDPGAIVCACFEVGLNQIIDAVGARGCATVDAVGSDLGAGTNCGTCRIEIKRIIDETRLQKAS
jgi:assimilatory nitrate reductase catalytic subunit